jgi:hypothetical protein
MSIARADLAPEHNSVLDGLGASWPGYINYLEVACSSA